MPSGVTSPPRASRGYSVAVAWRLTAYYLLNQLWTFDVAGEKQIGASAIYNGPSFGSFTHREGGEPDIPNGGAAWSFENAFRPSFCPNTLTFDDQAVLQTIDGLQSDTVFYRHVLPPMYLQTPIDRIKIEPVGGGNRQITNGGASGFDWGYYWHTVAVKFM